MATVTVRIPTSLRSFTGGEANLRVDAPTVKEALRVLVEQHPALGSHLTSSDGKLRNSISVLVNREDIRHHARVETRLADGDFVEIVAEGPSDLSRTTPAVALPDITGDDLRRYSRHLLLPEVGVAGQRRLRSAKVLIVGTGGLGSPAALYLAAAGVGTLGLVDFDVVDLSNLQRQVLYGTGDVGKPKLAAAAARLTALNPGTRLVRHEERLEARNAREIIRQYDVVLDGTDNFPTRYLVNDACFFETKPNVYGSIYRFEGQVSVFDARHGPCYRCLYAEPPPPDLVPSCAEAGVLGVLPGLVGVLQATEAVKLLLGIGEPLIGRILLYDALAMKFRELTVRKNPTCDLCSPTATQRGLIDYPAFCGVPAPGEVVDPGVPEISPPELRAALASADPPLLVDVREDEERTISALPGALAVPKAELTERLDELTRARAIVVFCRSGARSADATRTLLGLGFSNVKNLRGGINAWAEQVDPTLPVY